MPDLWHHKEFVWKSKCICFVSGIVLVFFVGTCSWYERAEFSWGPRQRFLLFHFFVCCLYVCWWTCTSAETMKVIYCPVEPKMIHCQPLFWPFYWGNSWEAPSSGPIMLAAMVTMFNFISEQQETFVWVTIRLCCALLFCSSLSQKNQWECDKQQDAKQKCSTDVASQYSKSLLSLQLHSGWPLSPSLAVLQGWHFIKRPCDGAAASRAIRPSSTSSVRLLMCLLFGT